MEALLKSPTANQLYVLIPLGIVLLIATYTDLKEKKVYNKLTYPAVGVGLICHTLALGIEGLISALIGAVALFAAALLLFIGGAMRGGDVKLLTVVGAFLGWYSGFEVFFYAMLTGSIGGIIVSIFNGYFIQMLKNLYMILRSALRVLIYRTGALWEKPEFDERSWLPFSTWILLGAIFTWTNVVYQWPGLFVKFLAVFKF